MKGITDKTPSKASEIQGTGSVSRGLKGQSHDAGQDDTLLDEFSAMLDKIAARLNQNINDSYQEFSVSAATLATKTETLRPQEKKTGQETPSGSRETYSQAASSSGNTTTQEKEVSAGQNSQTAVQAGTPGKERAAGENNEAAQKPSGGNGGAAGEVKTQQGQTGDTKTSGSETGAEQQAGAGEVSAQEIDQLLKHAATGRETEIKDFKGVKTQAQATAQGKEGQPAEDAEAAGPTAQVLKTIEEVLKEQLSRSETSSASVKLSASSAKADGAQPVTDTRDLSAVLLGTNVKAVTPAAEGLKGLIEHSAIKGISGAAQGGSSAGQGQVSMFGGKNGSEEVKNPKSHTPAPLNSQLAYKTLERIEAALREAARFRDGKTISLRLDPPDLGAVKVDVSLREGSLHARLSADSGSVSQMLRERAHDLQNALRKLGLNVEKITVAVNSELAAERTFEKNFEFNGNNSGSNKQGNEENSGRFDGLNGGDNVRAEIPAAEQSDHWIA